MEDNNLEIGGKLAVYPRLRKKGKHFKHHYCQDGRYEGGRGGRRRWWWTGRSGSDSRLKWIA